MGSTRRLAPSLSRLPATACLLLAVSCATGYHSRGFLGTGYSQEKLASGLWLVTFDASAFTPRQRVASYLLLRCAEVTVENGASFFAILGTGIPSRREPTKSGLIDQPPFPLPSGHSSEEPVRRSGRSARAAIQLYTEKPEEEAYDARELIRHLAPAGR